MGYGFKKYQPLSLRLWHWLNAFAILALLGTVLLRKTLLSWRTNSALISQKLSDAGHTISPELARDIAVSIRNPLWDWHINLGLLLSVLLLIRIWIAWRVERTLPGLAGAKIFLNWSRTPKSDRRSAAHFALVKTGYAVFYLMTAFMVISGLALTYQTELGLTKDLTTGIKEAHEISMWFFVIFITGHLVGVVAAENGKSAGIVSDMIHGGAPVPEEKNTNSPR